APEEGSGVAPWAHVDARMRGARNYWVGTSGPDGRPHAMPVWGVWMDDRLHFATDRHSKKARNLAANPACVVHLARGDDVVILEGIAEEVADRQRLAAIDDRYVAKDGVGVAGDPRAGAGGAGRPRGGRGWQGKER